MNNRPIQQILRLKNLPTAMQKENSVRLELEQGVVVFRASESVRERVAELLEKIRIGDLTADEASELDAYGEIDDYLSHVNHLIRNSLETSEVNLAA